MLITTKFVRAFERNAPQTNAINGGQILRATREADFFHVGRTYCLTLTAESKVSIPQSERRGYTPNDVETSVTLTVWDSAGRLSGTILPANDLRSVFPNLNIDDDELSSLVDDLVERVKMTDDHLNKLTVAREAERP